MNVFLISCFFLLGVSSSYAEDDDKPVQVLRIFAEPGSIVLSAKTQALSGLQTMKLKPIRHQAEFTAYGIVVNLQPLMELRRRYLLVLTEQRSAMAKFKQAEQNIKRQQDLYREGATSTRNLQIQQAQWQADKSLVDAGGLQGKAIVDEALFFWGKKLTDLALSTDSDRLNAFLTGQKTLLHITLPVNKQLTNSIQNIEVEAAGNRSAATKAELISAALHIDNATQGESYFFQTKGEHLRTGMRVAAWIPEQAENQSGVVIPKSALIWHLDQAFVYVQISPEHFHRRTIDLLSATTDGYFVSNGLDAGELLVITGAQMLLSEELKGQIPNEDD
jgi:hypothetical protein